MLKSADIEHKEELGIENYELRIKGGKLEEGCKVKAEYEKIINFKYTGVKNHVPADRMARAAQFSPFAALSGHDKYLRETERKNVEYHENLNKGKLEESC